MLSGDATVADMIYDGFRCELNDHQLKCHTKVNENFVPELDLNPIDLNLFFLFPSANCSWPRSILYPKFVHTRHWNRTGFFFCVQNLTFAFKAITEPQINFYGCYYT